MRLEEALLVVTVQESATSTADLFLQYLNSLINRFSFRTWLDEADLGAFLGRL